MINSKHSTLFKYCPLIPHLRWLGIFVLLTLQLSAASPPKQLSRVIKNFMNLESVSININQVIDWRFSDKADTVRIQMDIKAGKIFHVLLAGYGMEIFVTENEMISLNHVRQQVLLETASPDALLKQLFVGGDLNQARYKGEKQQSDGNRRLDFQFGGDFSDWESLSVFLSEGDHLEKLILVDYDGNKYIISLTYLTEFKGFDIPQIKMDYPHYQIADLRDR